jgi:hypothetical protein
MKKKTSIYIENEIWEIALEAAKKCVPPESRNRFIERAILQRAKKVKK